MQIDKDTIISFLKEQGHQDKAQQASDQLPDKVDTDQHASLLSKIGDKLGGILGNG